MSLILSLETATKNCSVSLSRNGEVIALKEHAGEGFEHAEKLHVFIQNCLSDAGLGFQDIDAVAVSRGPGSYTGLRIGVSAAKGLCTALEIPLIALDTLEILASAAKIEDGFIVPMIDARRMEVYTSVFDKNLQVKVPVEALILDGNSFSNLEGNVHFLGDSNEKAMTVLKADNFRFLEVKYPSAKEMAALAFAKFSDVAFEDVAYFDPLYLKDFIKS